MDGFDVPKQDLFMEGIPIERLDGEAEPLAVVYKEFAFHRTAECGVGVDAIVKNEEEARGFKGVCRYGVKRGCFFGKTLLGKDGRKYLAEARREVLAGKSVDFCDLYLSFCLEGLGEKTEQGGEQDSEKG